MIPGTKKTVLFLWGAWIWASAGAALAVLPTEDLTRLKASNVGESVIRLMIENDYDDVDRVMKLKQAGFSDETITSVIKGDLKARSEVKQSAPQPERATREPEKIEQTKPTTASVVDAKAILQTPAKVTIEQYIAVGEPMVQNGQEIQHATISLLEDRRIKIEWQNSKPAGLVNFSRGKPFTSPFYWDLDKDDGLHGVSAKDGSFTLRTGYSHPGQPAVNRSRYWILHVTPENHDLMKRIRELLSE